MRHSVGSSEVSRDSPSSSNEEEDVTRALPLRLLARNGVAATAFPDALLRVEGMGTKGTHFRDRAKPEGGRRRALCVNIIGRPKASVVSAGRS